MKKNLNSVINNGQMSREGTIVKTSIIGGIANIFLAVFKAIVGLTTKSIAIILDAVNNVSDAASSLITIIGAKLAAKDPDKEHPFGYGRIEYLSAMIISVIILYAGITSFVEAIKSIINPERPSYDTTSLIIVAIAVVVKVILGLYVKRTGDSVNSDSLVASGKEALLDSVVSLSTLIAAGIFMIFDISLEAWLGAIISILIIQSGIEMLRDTISQILGERNDLNLVNAIKETVTGFKDVKGAHDLILNNYGPDVWTGSIHIEVLDTFSVDKLDKLSREIMEKVQKVHNVSLTAIGVYSINTMNEEAKNLEKKVEEIVLAHEHINQVHAFHADTDEKSIRLDMIVSLDAKDRLQIYRDVLKDLKDNFPEYELKVFVDTDFSEE